MSILTRTDLPSKKSRSWASLWASAGAAHRVNKPAQRMARCVVSMRQTIHLRPDLDQRLVEARALALGAFGGAGHLVLGEHVAAAPAARRLDPDIAVGGAGRLQHVFQVVLDLLAGELQLVGDGRYRPGLPEHFLDL